MVSNNEIFPKAASKQGTSLRYLIATLFTQWLFPPSLQTHTFLSLGLRGNPPPSYEIASKESYNGWIIWIFMPCKFLRRAYTGNCSMKKASSTLPHPPQTTPGVWRQKDSLPASHTIRSKQAPESWELKAGAWLKGNRSETVLRGRSRALIPTRVKH